MSKINFYILSDSTPDARFAFVCRLVEKAYKNRHRIYIHTDNEKDAHELDELLWTFREDSFLPHNLYGEGPDPAPPIQIGFNVIPEKQRDVLINLSTEVPSFHNQFSKILECVSGEETQQEQARERYKHYKTNGHSITTHKLETVENLHGKTI